jgi:hypothetical protein
MKKLKIPGVDMKAIIALLCVGLSAGAVADVEYGHFVRATTTDAWTPASITLNEGERIVIVNGDGLFTDAYSEKYRQAFLVDYGGNIIVRTIVFRFSSFDTDSWSTENDRIIVGACVVAPKTGEDNGKIIDYKIVRNETNTSPMNIVSLPDDNNGDVDLLVESSTDLQNWTAVYSGSAGTSNNAAFFRTRLIRK